jgi:hypothetical protein
LARIIKCTECLGGHHSWGPQIDECRETGLLRASFRDHGHVQHDRGVSSEFIFRVRDKASRDLCPLAKNVDPQLPSKTNECFAENRDGAQCRQILRCGLSDGSITPSPITGP